MVCLWCMREPQECDCDGYSTRDVVELSEALAFHTGSPLRRKAYQLFLRGYNLTNAGPPPAI
jgi:hypothetical protein